MRDLVLKGILPFIGGLTLLGAFVLSVKSYWRPQQLLQLPRNRGYLPDRCWFLVVGVIVMVVTARFLPRYFAEGITTPVRDEGSSTL